MSTQTKAPQCRERELYPIKHQDVKLGAIFISFGLGYLAMAALVAGLKEPVLQHEYEEDAAARELGYRNGRKFVRSFDDGERKAYSAGFNRGWDDEEAGIPSLDPNEIETPLEESK